MRIISRLDVKNNFLIKGINFEGLRKLGDPNKFAKKYYDQNIDEIIFLDNVASLYERDSIQEVLENTSKDVFIPITCGGGIRSVDDARKILRSGADKISINTAAIKNPKLITKISDEFGSQSTVVSIEAKKISENKWEAYTDFGREKTGIDVSNWIKEVTQLGAGEILITSIDFDGTKKGPDYKLIEVARNSSNLPLMVGGGIASKEEILEIYKKFNIDAIVLATILHYDLIKISSIKKYLKGNGVRVR